jgi:hypothetical protein
VMSCSVVENFKVRKYLLSPTWQWKEMGAAGSVRNIGTT